MRAKDAKKPEKKLAASGGKAEKDGEEAPDGSSIKAVNEEQNGLN